MEKEFIPRELAIRLKAIGYDEKVFAWSDIYNDFIFYMYPTNENNMNQYEEVISIPTWYSVFKWFREKHNIFSYIELFTNGDNIEMYDLVIYSNKVNPLDSIDYFTYEDAEYACLEKLIEIVESKLK